ncbi:hypothetical protein OU994_23090 [Pseudoduganella sp. SL102]|uniref:hypothetical protein n=1 Tax=Pseudoduganella sp. SL102 TaxID=2995154 RepID=UPI00248C400B|nr:hypothetical protein [Pseudoduganella sp. SL102]WBS01165.1 hypothetical protein OU994_23090 [Pseudoduganella sp. SL102]
MRSPNRNVIAQMTFAAHLSSQVAAVSAWLFQEYAGGKVQSEELIKQADFWMYDAEMVRRGIVRHGLK